LVLDYNEAAARALERLLHRFEFAVAPTSDPDEALGWLASHHPHVLFVDYAIPGSPGDELVRQIRATAGGLDVPIVAMGEADLPDPPELAAAWLPSPASEEDLLLALHAAIAASPDYEPPPERRRRDRAMDVRPRLTLFRPTGHLELRIEARTPVGMRVHSADEELALGSVQAGHVEWVDRGPAGARTRRVRLTASVDSVSQADDGWHCGLRVESAKPEHLWRRLTKLGD